MSSPDCAGWAGVRGGSWLIPAGLPEEVAVKVGAGPQDLRGPPITALSAHTHALQHAHSRELPEAGRAWPAAATSSAHRGALTEGAGCPRSTCGDTQALGWQMGTEARAAGPIWWAGMWGSPCRPPSNPVTRPLLETRARAHTPTYNAKGPEMWFQVHVPTSLHLSHGFPFPGLH